MKKFFMNHTVRRVAPLLLLLLPLLAHTAFKNNKHDFDVTKSLELYSDVFKQLDQYYVDSISPEELNAYAINAMLSKLDPYTQFYTEKEREAFDVVTTGEYGGIGSIIQQRDSIVIIAEPYEGMPAQLAGLKPGDVLVKIDTTTLKGMTTQQVSDRLKGEPNTTFTITLQRPNEDTLQVREVKRRKITMDAVPYYGMVSDSIGYIFLSSFTDKAAKQVRSALIDLQDNHHAKGLILDLRGNPGGLMEDAISIVNLFVPKGKEVLSTRGKIKQWDRTYKTTQNPVAPELPLVVMIDHSSASASEIVAGALQDMDRALIVGNQSYGKGLVQTTRPLAYNNMVKLTTAKYYIPSGRLIQAIDYSHRNPDGSVARTPDSLTTAYKTANGRIVKDGGGIKPEVVIEEERIGNICIYLMNQFLPFNFATDYAVAHPTIASVEEFEVTDTIYNAFKAYVKSKDFTYDRQSEKALKSLREIAEFEGYMEGAAEEFKALEQKLTHNLDKDLDTFRPQIAELLANEIVKRYYYQRGVIKHSLKEDKALKSAIEQLEQPESYRKLLAPPTPTANDKK